MVITSLSDSCLLWQKLIFFAFEPFLLGKRVIRWLQYRSNTLQKSSTSQKILTISCILTPPFLCILCHQHHYTLFLAGFVYFSEILSNSRYITYENGAGFKKPHRVLVLGGVSKNAP